MAYYLIKLFPHRGKEQFKKFKNFEEIKKEAIQLLDISGWDNKNQVDLRSVRSCLIFIYGDFRNYRLTKTTSLNKFLNWY